VRHNYLAAAVVCGGGGGAEGAREIALARLDLSTGAFSVASSTAATLLADLAVHAPRELLLPQSFVDAGSPAVRWRGGGAAYLVGCPPHSARARAPCRCNNC
jgi:DNA mismatch repair ATPase MutS